MSEAQRMVLNVKGMRFDALAMGAEGGPLVLFLHGFPQFADAWVEVMRPLTESGYWTVAVDQRGYSLGARPGEVSDYAIQQLASDVLGFADVLGAATFHLVGHDWGGLVAWYVAAKYPERLRTLSVLSTPHIDAFSKAVRSDPDQMFRSKYILLFKAPGHVAESLLLADGAKRLRGAYECKVPEAQVEANVRRFSEEGALTAALNWYRSLKVGGAAVGRIAVPTLYIWGEQDHALGETAAVATAGYVDAPYRFVRLAGKSHWLLEDARDEVVGALQKHLAEHPGAA